MSLYDVFGSKNKEELYEKVKSDNESVSELIDFLDYSRGTLHRRNPLINQSNTVVPFLSNFKAPKKDEFLLVFSDKKLRATNMIRENLNSFEPRDAFKEALSNTSSNYILVYNSQNKSKDFEDVKQALNLLGFVNADDFEYHEEKRKYKSFKKGDYYNVKFKKQLKDFNPHKEIIPTYPEFKEFIEYYLKKETLGLSILNHAERIKENLKLAFQDRNQEEMGLVIYDKNKDVIAIEKISLGSVDYAPASPKILFNSLLNFENAKGFVLFHNHPSGEVSPSNPDVSLTQRLLRCSIIMDFEMADHFILGKEGVYSFAQDGVFEFGCHQYNEILHQPESNVFEDLEFYAKEDEMQYYL